MKKALALIPLVITMTACSSFGKKDSRAEVVMPDPIQKQTTVKAPTEKPEDKKAETVVSTIPNWYKITPVQEGFMFGTGTARSRDLEMAKEKALSLAQGKIAEAVGGKVTKQTKIFKTEAGTNVIESSSTLVKKLASDVDFTGTEVREVVVLLEPGGYFRTYVLVALPLGENNLVLKQQMDAAMTRELLTNERKELKEVEEVEKNNKNKPSPNKLLGEKQSSVSPVQEINLTDSKEVASLPHNSISNDELKAKISDKIKNDPNTVVLTTTVR